MLSAWILFMILSVSRRLIRDGVILASVFLAECSPFFFCAFVCIHYGDRERIDRAVLCDGACF